MPPFPPHDFTPPLPIHYTHYPTQNIPWSPNTDCIFSKVYVFLYFSFTCSSQRLQLCIVAAAEDGPRLDINGVSGAEPQMYYQVVFRPGQQYLLTQLPCVIIWDEQFYRDFIFVCRHKDPRENLKNRRNLHTNLQYQRFLG